MADGNKIIGVLGGMGPDATVDFMSKVIALTPADKDQDHIHMIVDHNPGVPNRQAAILGDGADPGPELAAMAARLEAAGADYLVIPCNTAYVFKGAVTSASSLPLISIIDVTVADAVTRDAKSVGVLATDGCLDAGVYQDALTKAGLTPVLPTEAEIEQFMTLCHRIKAGYQGERVARDMAGLAKALVDRGADAVIAGCTEIPLVLKQSALDVPLISSTDVLATATVALARGDQL